VVEATKSPRLYWSCSVFARKSHQAVQIENTQPLFKTPLLDRLEPARSPRPRSRLQLDQQHCSYRLDFINPRLNLQQSCVHIFANRLRGGQPLPLFPRCCPLPPRHRLEAYATLTPSRGSGGRAELPSGSTGLNGTKMRRFWARFLPRRGYRTQPRVRGIIVPCSGLFRYSQTY
jgi:hypothetical protein